MSVKRSILVSATLAASLFVLGFASIARAEDGGAGGAGGAGGQPSDGEPTVQPSATPDFTSCAVDARGPGGQGGLSLALGVVAVASAIARSRRPRHAR